MPKSIPDWQLPAGVNRGLWDYLHDTKLARTYDESLQDCRLLQLDGAFVAKHCTPPGKLIDLGCGTGRMLIPLARQGHWVIGVDLSEEMLRIVGEKAEAAQVSVQRLQANLVELDGIDDQMFDYALCLFSTLGMICGRENRRRVLNHVYRLLRPGGIFILHVHNRWFNFWNPQGRKWLLKDCLRSLAGSKETGDRHMPAHDGQSSLNLHLFTRREIMHLLRATGFQPIEVQPVGLRDDGKLRHPRWFGWLRAYGYLIAAKRPSVCPQTS